MSLRRLENKALEKLNKGQIQFGMEQFNPIKVSISQFYGIEINDFTVTVAKTALWIAESQMMKKTEEILHLNLDFLPLKSYSNIIEGNALRMDWNEVVPKEELDYIMGNPPFIGATIMNKEQKYDINYIFEGWKNAGNLDYVCGWYKKCVDMMNNNDIRTALVSTNSISQGETVANLWKPLFEMGTHIDFAHTTFQWDSQSNSKAHVHCVIIGFSIFPNDKNKTIYTSNRVQIVKNINGYLLNAENIFIERRTKPLCDVPLCSRGNQPTDGGNLIIEDKDYKNFINNEPKSQKYIKKLIGSYEFINRKDRYCLWLVDVPPNELRSMPKVMDRIQKVKEMREKSSFKPTRELANKPTLFREILNPETYIVIPRVSSEKRKYIPMGFENKDTIPTDSVIIIPNAKLYHFGILTSNVHMSWVRAVCGRLKSDYRYSKDIVYNNFPMPKASKEQKEKIEKTAQLILDTRNLYPNSSLADLYDELTMPPELRKAHQENDKAVMEAYRFDWRTMTESDCVAELMKLYEELKNTID